MAGRKKWKYYLGGIIAVLALLVGYHFFAAHQAERQIDRAIQQQAGKHGDISVQYTSLRVSPFTATVSFEDLNLIAGSHIERANSLRFDMGYLDFLNIYIGGLSYGLERLEKVTLTAIRPSYLNKEGLQEVKSDTLHIIYRGNTLEGVRGALFDSPLKSTHSIEASSAGLTIAIPKSTFSKVTADSLHYSGTISPGNISSLWNSSTHLITADSLLWTPSESFQNTYNFFIKGFGYSPDAIPFHSARFRSEPASSANALNVEASVRSDLALFSGSGLIQLEEPLAQSQLQEVEISATELSDTFRTVLDNLERLLSISLGSEGDSVKIKMKGTISSPQLSK